MLNGIVYREKLISASSTTTMADDHEDKGGFYFRCKGAGDVNYVPMGNDDSENIIETFEAQPMFINPVFVKKILKASTTATGIYKGKEA
jgi:hypothetical protein